MSSLLSAVIETVGEGFGNPDLDPALLPPLELEVGKVLEWLKSRELVRDQWRQVADIVGGKKDAALAALPESAATSATINALVDYPGYLSLWRCQEMLSAMKEAEVETRNFLGSYGSDAVSAWQDIVNQYLDGRVYLARAVRALVDGVRYELPSLLRSLASADASVARLARVESTAAADIARFRKEYVEMGSRFGLTLNVSDGGVGRDASVERDALSALAAKVPAVLEQALLSALDERTRVAAASAMARYGHPLPVLSWFCERVEDRLMRVSSERLGALASAIGLEVGALGESSSIGVLLRQLQVRSALLAELDEVHGFLDELMGQVQEVKASDDRVASSILLSQRLNSVSLDEVAEERDALAVASRAFEAKEIKELLLIDGSPRYVARIAAELHSKLYKAAQLEAEVATFGEQRSGFAASKAKTTALIKACACEIRELKNHIEADISSEFNGRIVRITGVDRLLAQAAAVTESSGNAGQS